MGRVILSGHIEVPEMELEVVTEALKQHIELTRSEPGCLVFEVSQSSDSPTHFKVYEEFVDKTAFEFHQTRVKESYWGQVTENVTRSYIIEELTPEDD